MQNQQLYMHSVIDWSIVNQVFRNPYIYSFRCKVSVNTCERQKNDLTS